MQIESKGCIFLHPTSEGVEEVREILLGGDLYQFLCLCSEPAPGPYVFNKLLKIPIAFFRRIDTLSIIYLENFILT